MGVDTKVHLPGNCRLSNVTTVLGLLLGHEPRWRRAWKDTRWVDAFGASYAPSSIPEVASIRVSVGGRGNPLWIDYHFEDVPPFSGGRLLNLGRSSGLTVALAVRVVDFFGVAADFQDCDDVDADFARPPRSDEENGATDGDAWDALQERMAAVRPLTREEVAYWGPRSACDDDSHEYAGDLSSGGPYVPPPLIPSLVVRR